MTRLLLLACLLPGCVVDEVRYEGRPCSASDPCGGGLSCVGGSCRQAAGPDLAPADAPRPDTAPPDGGAGDHADLPRSDKGQPDATLVDASPCNPPCRVNQVCCPAVGATAATCAASLGECACDPNAGVPCGGAFPVCCDKGSGTTCQATAEACKCSVLTGNPCFGAYPVCCTNKGKPDAGPLCQADNTEC